MRLGSIEVGAPQDFDLTPKSIPCMTAWIRSDMSFVLGLDIDSENVAQIVDVSAKAGGSTFQS